MRRSIMLLLMTMLILATSCNVAQTRDYVKDDVRFISKETLTAWMAGPENPLIVNVLSAESYAEAHIKGSINIPLTDLPEKAATLDKEQKIVVYCANYMCHASTQAAKLLGNLGFKDVSDYKGGIDEWKKAGLPIGRVTPSS